MSLNNLIINLPWTLKTKRKEVKSFLPNLQMIIKIAVPTIDAKT
jgi:hypothetical protein